MLFELGFQTVKETCPTCESQHRGIQIGEEVVLCSCGNVFSFRRNDDYVEYFWVSRREIRAATEEMYNSDARNLC